MAYMGERWYPSFVDGRVDGCLHTDAKWKLGTWGSRNLGSFTYVNNSHSETRFLPNFALFFKKRLIIRLIF